jgi:hypothetical protein
MQNKLKKNLRRQVPTPGHECSWMLAAAGWTVQYANEEFRCWENHKFIKPGETNESVFSQAKQNWADAYA